MKDFSSIPVFLAVVEEHSFSKAAETLGITTSAVSKRVSNLESNLGVKLLHRTTRKLRLTESGERYLKYAYQASSALEDAKNAAIEKKDVPSGTLRISVPATTARVHLGTLVPKFLEEYPLVNIHMEMIDVFTDFNVEDFDLILSPGYTLNSSYKAIKVMSIGGVTCASPDFIAKYGKPNTPEELINFNCLLPSMHKVVDDWVYKKNDEEIKVKVSGNYYCNSPEVVRIAALSGLGITCLSPGLLKSDLEKGNLVALLTDYINPNRELRAIYPDKQYTPAKVNVFIDFLLKHLGTNESSSYETF